MSARVYGALLGTLIVAIGAMGYILWTAESRRSAFETEQIARAEKPGTDWLEIIQLNISDAEPGGDPRLAYGRDIKMTAPGTWSVNIFRHRNEKDDIGTVYCSGSGQATYKAGRELPPAATKLSWLIGKPLTGECALTDGIYKAVVTVVITPDGFPTKVVERESNYFVVPPKEPTP